MSVRSKRRIVESDIIDQRGRLRRRDGLSFMATELVIDPRVHDCVTRSDSGMSVWWGVHLAGGLASLVLNLIGRKAGASDKSCVDDHFSHQ
jgi:hypothetical protein